MIINSLFLPPQKFYFIFLNFKFCFFHLLVSFIFNSQKENENLSINFPNSLKKTPKSCPLNSIFKLAISERLATISMGPSIVSKSLKESSGKPSGTLFIFMSSRDIILTRQGLSRSFLNVSGNSDVELNLRSTVALEKTERKRKGTIPVKVGSKLS